MVAWIPNFVVAAAASSVRFSVGWYAGRGLALLASFMLLIVLLSEMVVLYSRLRKAFALLRREPSFSEMFVSDIISARSADAFLARIEQLIETKSSSIPMWYEPRRSIQTDTATTVQTVGLLDAEAHPCAVIGAWRGSL
jgi:hypothetical protein